MSQRAETTYRENSVLAASPVKLVTMVYDRALTHLQAARVELQDPDTRHSARAGEALSKAQALVGELRSCLNMDQGEEIALYLDRLYEYALHRLSRTNQERDPELLDSVLEVLGQLKEAWDGVASQPA
jgi:flagellar protein FliS